MGSLEDGPPSKRKKTPEDTVGPTKSIWKEEFVRIITEALYSLGYDKSVEALEKESGIELFSPMAKSLVAQLRDRKWDQSVATLCRLPIQGTAILKVASFLIYEHKFFELLEKGSNFEALMTLRNEITPLGICQMRVHELSIFIISGNKFETAGSEANLEEVLRKLLPTKIMVPKRRLEHLVEMALGMQANSCVFHNSSDAISLYNDHYCTTSQIPTCTVQTLHAHKDEVWFLQFSRNGKYLASASRDKTAIVWEVHENGELSLKSKLEGHSKPILMLTWSPNSQMLLTCGDKEVVKLWNVITGECLSTYEQDNMHMITCGFFLHGTFVFTVATNKNICQWTLGGTCFNCLSLDLSCLMLDVFFPDSDGTNVRFIGKVEDKVIELRGRISWRLTEVDAITSFSLSRDENFLLVNLVNQEIHLWSIEEEPRLEMIYCGHKRSRFVIRSCFGGFEEKFIASGSEDSQVYTWLRSTGEPIYSLTGHSGSVNCVSWNPTNPHMLASASDDRTIRIWGLQQQ